MGSSGGTNGGGNNKEPLEITYTIEDIDARAKAVILGVAGFSTIEEYMLDILKEMSYEEKVQIFIDGELECTQKSMKE